jgi:hypothetical protein
MRNQEGISAAFIIIVIVLIIVFAGGVYWYNVSQDDNNSISNTNSSLKTEECLADGGKIEYNTDGSEFRCYYPYADARNECTSSDQCEGSCVTNKLSNLGKIGTCQTTTTVHIKCETPIENNYLSYRVGDMGFRCSLDDWTSQCDNYCEK